MHLLGIVCPTYLFDIPVIVKNKNKSSGNNYAYGVTTYGGYLDS